MAEGAAKVALLPTLSTRLSIEPSTFHPGSGLSQDPPIITLTVTLHAKEPLTLFTWPTIFNLDLSQRRSNFTCLDLKTNQYLHLEFIKGPKRRAFSREAGGPDDAYFHTLEPEIAVSFATPFKLASRTTEGPNAISPDRRYRFAVQDGETVPWWRYGVKSSVMVPAGQRALLGDPSGPPLVLMGLRPVEYHVLEK